MKEQKLCSFCFVTLAALLVMLTAVLSGCAGEAQQNGSPVVAEVVYDDGVYAVEAGKLTPLQTEEGKEIFCLELTVTNGSLDDLVITSVLGVRVNGEAGKCEVVRVPQDSEPIDGLIPAGQSAVGCIAFAAPSGCSGFTVELAVDYLNDVWISFTVSR